MSKIVLTEEMCEDGKLYEEWLNEARNVKRDTLERFIFRIMDCYEHCYSSYVNAVTICAIAATYACGSDLSGFQANYVALLYPKYYYYPDTLTGIGIRLWDGMLYPENEKKFDKVMSPTIWESIQKVASELYKENKDDPEVPQTYKHHWKSIIDGNVPFGYFVKES